MHKAHTLKTAFMPDFSVKAGAATHFMRLSISPSPAQHDDVPDRPILFFLTKNNNSRLQKWEWAVNQQRDSYASYVGHHSLCKYPILPYIFRHALPPRISDHRHEQKSMLIPCSMAYIHRHVVFPDFKSFSSLHILIHFFLIKSGVSGDSIYT